MKKAQIAIFVALQAAIVASPEGFVYADATAAAPFVKEALIELNPQLTNEKGEVAARLTEKGKAYGAVPAPLPAFEIQSDIAIPTGRSAGAGVKSKFPFDKLEKGQSFFVEASEQWPEPHRNLASTVSSATQRYAEVDPAGGTHLDRKGNTVPDKIYNRKFIIREVEENGKKGARIWRTE